MTNIKNKILIPIILLPLWALIYIYLEPSANYIVYNIFGMDKSNHLTEAIRFFLFEVPKVLMLLTLIVFAMSALNNMEALEKVRENKSSIIWFSPEYWNEELIEKANEMNLIILKDVCPIGTYLKLNALNKI